MEVPQHPSKSFLNPNQILQEVGVAFGMNVADLGCGGGYFVLPAARIIGDDGISYGVDVIKEALSTVESKARTFGLSNVKTVWSNVEIRGGAKEIKDNTIDVVLLVQLFSETKGHEGVFEEVTRIINPNGSLVVIDWKGGKDGFGPQGRTIVPQEVIEKLAMKFNFTPDRIIDAGKYHYAVIFKKQ